MREEVLAKQQVGISGVLGSYAKKDRNIGGMNIILHLIGSSVESMGDDWLA
jgi:hypothetical protein